MKQLGVFLLPPGLPPSIKSAGTHLYTWVERGIVKQQGRMSQARAWTKTVWSRDKCTNHEATTPPTGTL